MARQRLSEEEVSRYTSPMGTTSPTGGNESFNKTIAHPIYNFVRSLGMGMPLDIMGSSSQLFNMGVAGLTGQKTLPYNPAFSETQQKEWQQNPVTAIVKSAGRDILGGASFMVPGGTGIASRAGLGALQGYLGGVSEEGATPGSIAMRTGSTAALNAFLPVVGEQIAKGLGRTSIGKGGEALPAIIKESGKAPQVGEDLKDAIFRITSPIREKLDNLLSGSSATVSKAEILGKKLKDGGFEGGILGDLYQSPQSGIAGKRILSDYGNELEKIIDGEFYRSTGLNPENMDWSEVKLPIKSVNNIRQIVGNDFSLLRGYGKKLYMPIRKKVLDAVADPKEGEKLLGYLQSAHYMNESIDKKALPTIMNQLKSVGLPLEMAYSILKGNIPTALGGLAAKAATTPSVAVPAISALGSPVAGGMENIISRIAGQVGGSLFK